MVLSRHLNVTASRARTCNEITKKNEHIMGRLFRVAQSYDGSAVPVLFVRSR